MASMKKSTLTTLLGLLFVLPFSSCEAVPSGSEASLKTLASSTSESSLEDSLSTGGTASSLETSGNYPQPVDYHSRPGGSFVSVNYGAPTLNKLYFELNNDLMSYSVRAAGPLIRDDVVVPAKYNDLPVTTISDEGFKDCDKVTSVYLPAGIKKIGKSAFQRCGGFNGFVFYGIPYTVTYIDDSAFASANLNNIIIPIRVTHIGERAFWGNSLSSIVIPDSVTYIGDQAFGNNNFISVTIPKNVTSLGHELFLRCAYLTRIEVDSYNPNYSSYDGVLYNKDQTVLVEFPSGRASLFRYSPSIVAIGDYAFSGWRAKTTSLSLPSSITEIGAYAFADCSSLTSITLPNSLERIGESAFSDCRLLESIDLPEGIECIPDFAFADCSKITSIVIPDSATSIGKKAFMSCGDLTSVTIGSGVTLIDEYAFWLCDGLQSITIPGNVTTVKFAAFRACFALESAVIENGVVTLEDEIFANCPALVSVEIPSSVTSIGKDFVSYSEVLSSINVDENNQHYSSLDGVLYDKAKTEVIVCPLTKTSYSFPSTVTSIREKAFNRCAFTSVSIPEGIASIGTQAFSLCSIESLALPNSLETLGYSTFASCKNLTSVTFGKRLRTIEMSTFSGCSSLTNVELSGNLETIGHSAFYKCTSLESIEIPGNVTLIDYSAFSECSSLTSVIINPGVTSIQNSCFEDCVSLTDIHFYGTIDDWNSISFGEKCFKGCPTITVHCMNGNVIIKAI